MVKLCIKLILVPTLLLILNICQKNISYSILNNPFTVLFYINKSSLKHILQLKSFDTRNELEFVAWPESATLRTLSLTLIRNVAEQVGFRLRNVAQSPHDAVYNLFCLGVCPSKALSILLLVELLAGLEFGI